MNIDNFVFENSIQPDVSVDQEMCVFLSISLACHYSLSMIVNYF